MTALDTKALLPCPFCGDSANLEQWCGEASVLCSNCNARSAPFFAENEKQAIEAWNARDPRLARRVIELEEALRKIADDPYQYGLRVQKFKKIAAAALKGEGDE